MNRRMTLATGLLAALALTACGSSDEVPDPGASTTAPPTSEPAPEPTDSEAAGIESAEDLVGEWADPAAEWVVTFNEDGTFNEDFQGNEDFRTGDYEINDGIVSLVGGDGNTDKGEVDGESLVFRLGTLTRS